MDNVKIQHADAASCSVHHRLQGEGQIHRDYGLWILSTGRGGVSGPGRIFPRYFEFYSLSHLYDGDGMYWTPSGRSVEVKAGQGILIAPNFIHFYGAGAKQYIEDAICFYGPLADCFFRSGIIQNGIMEIGQIRRLLPVIELAADPAVGAQLSANVALQQLLLDLFHANRHHQGRVRQSRLEEMIAIIRATPEKWWTVEEMAEYCNLSTAQFRRVFLEHTGMLPKLYIDRIKVALAAEMLTTATGPLEEISSRLGYCDPFHFSRRFKQLTGFSPEQYRQESPHYHHI